VLHLLDHVGEHCFGRRRPKHNEQLVLDVCEEPQNGKACKPRNCAKHDQNKEQARQVEGCDQLQQIDKRRYAIGSDGECHRAERSNWRSSYNDADDAKENLGHDVDDVVDLFTEFTKARDRKACKNGNKQNLKQISLGKRAYECVGDDRQQMPDDALLFCLCDVARNGLGIEACYIDVEAFTGLQHLADDQSNEECECRNNLEIN